MQEKIPFSLSGKYLESQIFNLKEGVYMAVRGNNKISNTNHSLVVWQLLTPFQWQIN